MFLNILVILPLILGSLGDSYYGSVVETNYGKVGGIVKRTRLNGTYLSFAGIPFARPPIGDLRFANPEKPEAWTGILNGTNSGARCIQRNYLFFINPPVEGSEDCLYLNVYVPQFSSLRNLLFLEHISLLTAVIFFVIMPRPLNSRCKEVVVSLLHYFEEERDNNGPLIPLSSLRQKKGVINTSGFPVMVSIPWGGLLTGGGDEGYFDSSYLMDHDVIVVSFNYRLGAFGLLTTLDDEAPGNYALKDQVLALEWVQENIERFGGNKDKVTIMGQSAGAGSVNLLMLSPAARGLFSYAISQSGTAQALSLTPANALQPNTTLAQAQLVNCSGAATDSRTLIKCLRNVSAEDIALSQDAFKTFYQFPYLAFSLVTEVQTERNPKPFLTKTPSEYVTSGDFQKVPWLTGTVKNEGIIQTQAMLGPERERQDLNNNFSSILPELLALSLTTNDTNGLYQNISEFYLSNKNFIEPTDEWEQGLIDLWSDRAIVYSSYQAVSLQVASGHDSIYFYSFEYAGEQTFAGLWGNGSKLFNPNWTVSHCDDLLYLFKSPDLFENQLSAETDIAFSKIWLNLWVNFATYGNPNPPENTVLKDIKWDTLKLNRNNTFTNQDMTLLNVTGSYHTGARFNITRGFIPERIAFWEAAD